MTRITDLADFKAHLAHGHTQFAIALCGGALLSRKDVAPSEGGRYAIFHGIDGRFELLSEAALLTETNIGAALHVGTFYCEE